MSLKHISLGYVSFPSLPINKKRCVSAFSLLVTIVLLPMFGPFWIAQFLGSLGSLLSFLGSLFLSGSTPRDWLTGVVFVTGVLKQAREELDAEREFTEAEHDAFREFLNEVQSLSVHSSGTSAGGTDTVLVAGGGPGTDTLGTVREEYRNTVMDVPGYEAVYDETLAEHLSAEFGDDLSTVLLDDGLLTQPAQALLLAHTSEAVAQREFYLETIDREYDSILDANTGLQRTDSALENVNPSRMYRYSFDELLEHEQDLQRATETCEQLLTTRQREIHGGTQGSFPRSGRLTLQEYLYQSLETTYPVISSVLDRIHGLNQRRKLVLRSITKRY
jgi:hypothetical protein